MTLIDTKGCATCLNFHGHWNKACITCHPDPATNRGTNFVRDFDDFAQNTTKEADSVNHPSHYTRNPIEAIKAIEMILTEVYGEKGFEAYCFGNELKYRLRAGFKGDAQEDIGKALKYEEFRNRNFE